MNYWEQIKQILSRKISPPSYLRWLARTWLKRAKGTVLSVAVPDEVTKEWMQHEFAGDIWSAIRELDFPFRQIVYEVSAAEEEGILNSTWQQKK